LLFNSLPFAAFFPAVVALYFLTPQRRRWGLLLGASYYFYAAWRVEYLGLIILSTLVDYWAGLQMGARESRAQRRPYLLLSLGVNLGVLFTFKYFTFFSSSLSNTAHLFGGSLQVPALDLVLPIGISFYTFQTLAYTIDVYRDQQEPERHLGIFALYVSFFPQLVAGPIERSQNMLPQFHTSHSFDYRRAVDGLKQMLWGFFLKLVIADRLAICVDQVYGTPDAYGALSVTAATYFFAFQIYCDFAGYTRITIGAAQIMGYDLMENFRRPYFSKSIPEFWRRWHISLSTWFRDYVYIPLGGSRVARGRWYGNLFVVFLVSGLWHGAAWTFVVWGGLHGVYMIASDATSDVRNRIWAAIRRCRSQFRSGGRRATVPWAELPGTATLRRWTAVLTTFHLVLFGWVFFRAGSLADVTTILSRLLVPSVDLSRLTEAAGGPAELTVALLSIVVLLVVQYADRRRDLIAYVSERSLPIRWGTYLALTFAVILFGVFRRQEFIYFQF